MGTRSMTIVLDDDREICRIYRQFDGYPSGHGLDLAKLCNVTIVNGLSGQTDVANGMGCLAAQIVAGLKTEPGGIYLQPTGGEVGDWVEYIYIVTGKTGSIPEIQCSTQSGPFPFNVQDDKLVFKATPANKITPAFVKKLENA